jgi:hypothetical protein
MHRLGLCFALVCLDCLVAFEAAADMVPDGKKIVMHTYTVENADEFPEQLVIAYPYDCDWHTREPRGVGSQDSEVVGYDVILAGTEHADSPACKQRRIYVVDRTGLTVEPLERTPDGDRPIVVRELSAMRGPELAAFFADDPRVYATGYVVDPPRDLVDEGSTPVRKIHTVLRLERADAAFSLRGAQMVYTYDDNGVEALPYIAGKRPPPSGRGTPAAALPPAPLRMISEIPRWPWIVGACGVFGVMALFGLRRRS